MTRVVCTLVANGWIRGVLYSRVALDPVTFWRIRVKVDLCRLESYISQVVRDPQLGKSVRIVAATRLRRLDSLFIIVVNNGTW
jgi:hypothetical protein